MVGIVVLGACSAPQSPGQKIPTATITVADPVPGPTTRLSASPTPLPAWPAWSPGAAELYNLEDDPDRRAFGIDPRSHRTDWQATVHRPGGAACRASHAPVVHVTVTFWFLDDRQAQWFPSRQRLALRCGQTLPVRPSRTLHGTTVWLFQPDPPVNGPRDPNGVVQPPPTLNPEVDRLPLVMWWVQADRPGRLLVRWRSRTVAGEVSPWTSSTVRLPSDPPGWALQEAGARKDVHDDR